MVSHCYLRVYRRHFYFITVRPPEVSEHFTNSVSSSQSRASVSVLLPNDSPVLSLGPRVPGARVSRLASGNMHCSVPCARRAPFRPSVQMLLSRTSHACAGHCCLLQGHRLRPPGALWVCAALSLVLHAANSWCHAITAPSLGVGWRDLRRLASGHSGTTALHRLTSRVLKTLVFIKFWMLFRVGGLFHLGGCRSCLSGYFY